MIRHRRVRLTEGIEQCHAGVRDTQVAAMYAAFRSVHATAVGAQTVVKQFARCKSKNRTLSCLKYKGWNGSTVLPEVKHQCLAGTDSHRLPGGITAENAHATVMRFVSLLYSAPDVCRLWR